MDCLYDTYYDGVIETVVLYSEPDDEKIAFRPRTVLAGTTLLYPQQLIELDLCSRDAEG